jgi:hypothetical protein
MAKGKREIQSEAEAEGPQAPPPETLKPSDQLVAEPAPAPRTTPADELCAALANLIAYAVKIGPSTAPAVTAAQAALAKFGK